MKWRSDKSNRAAAQHHISSHKQPCSSLPLSALTSTCGPASQMDASNPIWHHIQAQNALTPTVCTRSATHLLLQTNNKLIKPSMWLWRNTAGTQDSPFRFLGWFCLVRGIFPGPLTGAWWMFFRASQVGSGATVWEHLQEEDRRRGGSHQWGSVRCSLTSSHLARRTEQPTEFKSQTGALALCLLGGGAESLSVKALQLQQRRRWGLMGPMSCRLSEPSVSCLQTCRCPQSRPAPLHADSRLGGLPAPRSWFGLSLCLPRCYVTHRYRWLLLLLLFDDVSSRRTLQQVAWRQRAGDAHLQPSASRTATRVLPCT